MSEPDNKLTAEVEGLTRKFMYEHLAPHPKAPFKEHFNYLMAAICEGIRFGLNKAQEVHKETINDLMQK